VPTSATWTSTEDRNNASSEALTIGAAKNNGIVNYWDGLIDEVTIYKRTLSGGERSWLYNNGLGRAYSDLTPPTTNPGTTGLTSWWTLNETSGARNDSYGTNHLTDNNTVTSVSGKQGSAAQFASANSEYLSIGDNASLSPTLITICAWVYLDSKNENRGFVSKWDASTTNRSFLLNYETTNDRFKFYIQTSGTDVLIVSATNFGSPTINTWYFLCGWYDGTSAYISVNNSTPESVSAPSNTLKDSTASFLIGRTRYDGPFQDGRIDEVVLYSRVLAPTERAWLYNNGVGRTYTDLTSPTNNPGTSSLTSWWTMNETSGNRSDSYGTNLLTDMNTVLSASGKQATAADFEFDNSEYLTAPSNSQLNMSASDIYVSAWIKPESVGAWHIIVSKRGDTDAVSEYQLRVDSTNHPGFAVWGTTGATVATSSGTLAAGQWYFVEGWTDKANRTVYVNVNNGVPTSATWTSTEDRNNASSEALTIGAAKNNGIVNYWDGLIDEVTIYKRTALQQRFGSRLLRD